MNVLLIVVDSLRFDAFETERRVIPLRRFLMSFEWAVEPQPSIAEWCPPSLASSFEGVR